MTDPDAEREAALRGLGHDLRSPLAVIVGFADVIARREELDDDDRREYAQRITAAANEIRDLIEAAGL